MPWESHHDGLVLPRQWAGSPGTCNPEEIGLNHPPYSPDLAPSNYHLFPGLKKQLKGRHLLNLLNKSRVWSL
jgi:hypothetical protein